MNDEESKPAVTNNVSFGTVHGDAAMEMDKSQGKQQSTGDGNTFEQTNTFQNSVDPWQPVREASGEHAALVDELAAATEADDEVKALSVAEKLLAAAPDALRLAGDVASAVMPMGKVAGALLEFVASSLER